MALVDVSSDSPSYSLSCLLVREDLNWGSALPRLTLFSWLMIDVEGPNSVGSATPKLVILSVNSPVGSNLTWATGFAFGHSDVLPLHGAVIVYVFLWHEESTSWARGMVSMRRALDVPPDDQAHSQHPVWPPRPCTHVAHRLACRQNKCVLK